MNGGGKGERPPTVKSYSISIHSTSNRHVTVNAKSHRHTNIHACGLLLLLSHAPRVVSCEFYGRGIVIIHRVLSYFRIFVFSPHQLYFASEIDEHSTGNNTSSRKENKVTIEA